MILNGASSHKSKDLKILHMRLIFMLLYSPELNPADRLNILAGTFSRTGLDSLKKAVEQAEKGLSALTSNRDTLASLTCWPWIRAILNAFLISPPLAPF